ncbi:Hypothetical_protein [Hexamita inflata]|nr:Hypothetical protein HINF_LOCUS11886 [Hexamita inflata]
MSSFQPDRQVGPEKDENKEEAEQIINSILIDADSQNNQQLASQLKQVKFHVKDCEETFKKIESILNVNREQFMHGKASISPNKTGVSLSFFVKPQYYELIWPLQELLTIKKQIQSVQPDSPIVPKVKQNNQSVKPITFLIDNVERFLSQIENTLNIQRSAFMQGKPDIKKQSTGKHILQIFTPLQYYNAIQQQFSNYMHIGNKQKKNIIKQQSETVKITNKNMQQANSDSKAKINKIITFLIDNVEQFLKQIEQTIGVLRSAFMHGKPNINMHNTGKQILSFTTPIQYYDKIFQRFTKFLYSGLRQKANNESLNLQLKHETELKKPIISHIQKPLVTKVQQYEGLIFHVIDCEEALKIMESTLNVKREYFMEGIQTVTKTQFGYQLQFVAKQNYIELLKSLQESLFLKFEKVVSITDNCEETICKLEAYLNLTRDKFCSKVSITKLEGNINSLTLKILSQYVPQALLFLNGQQQDDCEQKPVQLASIVQPHTLGQELNKLTTDETKLNTTVADFDSLNEQKYQFRNDQAFNVQKESYLVQHGIQTVTSRIFQESKPTLDGEQSSSSLDTESFDIEMSDEEIDQNNIQAQKEDSEIIEFNISNSEDSKSDQQEEKEPVIDQFKLPLVIDQLDKQPERKSTSHQQRVETKEVLPKENAPVQPKVITEPQQIHSFPPLQNPATIVVQNVEQFITELEAILGVERNQILTVTQDTALINGTHQIIVKINAENKKHIEQAIQVVIMKRK